MDHALLSWLDLGWKGGGHFDSYSRYVSEAMGLRQSEWRGVGVGRSHIV